MIHWVTSHRVKGLLVSVRVDPKVVLRLPGTLGAALDGGPTSSMGLGGLRGGDIGGGLGLVVNEL